MSKKDKPKDTLEGLAASFCQEIEVVKILKMLPVPLTPAGQWEITQALARALKKIDQLNDALKSIRSDYKSQIDKQQEIVNDLTAKINSGHEDRMVECELIKNYSANTITLMRLDTGEDVSARTMTAEERQKGLDLPPEPEAPATEAPNPKARDQHFLSELNPERKT